MARTRTTARPSPAPTTSLTVRRAAPKKAPSASTRAGSVTESPIAKMEPMNWRPVVSFPTPFSVYVDAKLLKLGCGERDWSWKQGIFNIFRKLWINSFEGCCIISDLLIKVYIKVSQEVLEVPLTLTLPTSLSMCASKVLGTQKWYLNQIQH